jgi:hypothetical protein
VFATTGQFEGFQYRVKAFAEVGGGMEVQTEVLGMSLEVPRGDELSFRFETKLDAAQRNVERAFPKTCSAATPATWPGSSSSSRRSSLLASRLLSVAVGLRIETGEEAFGEPGPLLGREPRDLALDSRAGSLMRERSHC